MVLRITAFATPFQAYNFASHVPLKLDSGFNGRRNRRPGPVKELVVVIRFSVRTSTDLSKATNVGLPNPLNPSHIWRYTKGS